MMSLRFVSRAALAVALALTAAPALACKGPNLQFSDDFKELDPAWSADGGSLSVSNGRMQMTSDKGYFGLGSYEGSFFPTGDFCVDVVASDVKDQTSIIAGIAFLEKDSSNMYVFAIRPDGAAMIIRRQNDGWLHPVPVKKFDGVKSGPNVVNTLRLTLKDGSATAYVNDKLFSTFKVVAEPNGKLGLYVEAEGTTYNFMKLRITD